MQADPTSLRVSLAIKDMSRGEMPRQFQPGLRYDLGISMAMGIPQKWMVFVRENPIYKWDDDWE